MTTTVVPAPDAANQTQAGRISVAKATALILGAHLHDGLGYPFGIRQNGVGEDLLSVDFTNFAELRSWLGFFGYDRDPQPQVMNDGTAHFIMVFARNWHGWTVQLNAAEPLSPASEPDPDTEALIAEALAAPDSPPPADEAGMARGVAPVVAADPVHAEVTIGPGGMIGVTFPAPADVDARVDELVALITEPTADEVQP